MVKWVEWTQKSRKSRKSLKISTFKKFWFGGLAVAGRFFIEKIQSFWPIYRNVWFFPTCFAYLMARKWNKQKNFKVRASWITALCPAQHNFSLKKVKIFSKYQKC